MQLSPDIYGFCQAIVFSMFFLSYSEKVTVYSAILADRDICFCVGGVSALERLAVLVPYYRSAFRVWIYACVNVCVCVHDRTFMGICLPACMFVCVLACLSTFLPVHLRACPPAHVSQCFPVTCTFRTQLFYWRVYKDFSWFYLLPVTLQPTALRAVPRMSREWHDSIHTPVTCQYRRQRFTLACYGWPFILRTSACNKSTVKHLFTSTSLQTTCFKNYIKTGLTHSLVFFP